MNTGDRSPSGSPKRSSRDARGWSTTRVGNFGRSSRTRIPQRSHEACSESARSRQARVAPPPSVKRSNRRRRARIAESLYALDDEHAWQLRERLYARAPHEVAGSLARLNSERARLMRDAWLGDVAAGFGERNLRASPYSVPFDHGAEDDRAWLVRDAALSVAPVAALASVLGASATRSWQLRARYLRRAPKTVMSTLHAVTDPRAWDMRNQVVDDCKEAIDSIAYLDTPEAWDLRERYLATWPWTVAENLGPLALGERGGDMLARLLQAHPRNISLLKHAAGVASASCQKESLEEP